MNLAAEARGELSRRGISVGELAVRIGTYPEKISRTLNGKREPSITEWDEIANAIGIDLDVLVRRAKENSEVAA